MWSQIDSVSNVYEHEAMAAHTFTHIHTGHTSEKCFVAPVRNFEGAGTCLFAIHTVLFL